MSTLAKRRTSAIVSTVAKRIKVHPKLSEEATSTGILNLADDCLAEVFTYLDESDLLNVIQANSRFKFATERVFKRKYCRNQVVVSNYHGTRLIVYKLKHSISVLEHFGHLISKLCIRFKLEKIESLLEAVVANCGENLCELEFYHLGIRRTKPSITFDYGLQRMRIFLNKLNTRFTNLQHLKFNYCNTSSICPYSDSIIQSIPTLSTFAVVETIYKQFLSEKNLKIFVALNGQLESLSLLVEVKGLDRTEGSWRINERFIRYLDRSLPMLKCLEINRVSTLEIPESVNYPVRFNNLTNLTFGSFLEFQSADCGFLSFLSEAVEVLKLSTFEYNIVDFLKSVTQFKKLKVLALEYPMKLMSRILDRDEVGSTVWSPNGIRQLILSNNQLTKIVIRLHPSEIDEEWIYDAGYLELKYRDVVDNKLNGSQWNVDGDSNCFSFHKVLEK